MLRKTSRKATSATKGAKKKSSEKITPSVLAKQSRAASHRNSDVRRRPAQKAHPEEASNVH